MNLRKELIEFLRENNWLSLEDERNATGVVDVYLSVYKNDSQKSSVLPSIIESPEIQKANLYAIMSIYLNGSEEVKNGIYDPIQEALTEIQSKYIIIQKDSL